MDLKDLEAIQATLSHRIRRSFFASSVSSCFIKQLLAAYADVAWWFGWNVQEIYDLPLDEFADWLDEVNRQIKAKYQK
ncbi:GpE family phage tail protein [Kingella kingae]|uniref:GpE family phage tail protein n=1 Tax=Kingella kingae TaxID=504 RepID=UPI0004102872|nr:GpE family phage tail protein [Kingella kingae]